MSGCLGDQVNGSTPEFRVDGQTQERHSVAPLGSRHLDSGKGSGERLLG